MPAADSRQIQWLRFNDFSPGIADRDFRATGVLGPWPLGTAVRAQTFRCRALPNGGLGPLPRRDRAFSFPWPPDVEEDTPVKVVGFLIQGAVRSTAAATDGYEEANWIVATEYLEEDPADPDDYRHFRIHRVRMWDNLENRDQIVGYTDAFAQGLHRTCYLASHRMHADDPQIAGTPLFCYAWWGDDQTGCWGVFPKPDDNDSVDPHIIMGPGDGIRPDKMVVYQGRSLICHRQDYNNGGMNLYYVTNENIYYTESNLPSVADSIASTFTPEDPGEIMGMVVSGANELFVLKRRHGAYVIRGDITFPSVLRIPGVMGTGKMPSEPCATPIGVVYTSFGSGVYAWPGGEESQCISRQLEPSNFDYDVDGLWAYAHNGGKPDFFQDLIFMPPRWVYDWKNDAWWQLEAPEDTEAPRGYMYFQKSMGKNAIIAVRAEYYEDEDYAFAYNFDSGCENYQWRSQPAGVSTERDVEVREIVLKATGAAGSTVIVRVMGRGVSEAHTFTLDGSDYPRIQRQNCALNGGDLQIQIEANSNATDVTAPTVYSVDLGYYETAFIPASA